MSFFHVSPRSVRAVQPSQGKPCRPSPALPSPAKPSLARPAAPCHDRGRGPSPHIIRLVCRLVSELSDRPTRWGQCRSCPSAAPLPASRMVSSSCAGSRHATASSTYLPPRPRVQRQNKQQKAPPASRRAAPSEKPTGGAWHATPPERSAAAVLDDTSGGDTSSLLLPPAPVIICSHPDSTVTKVGAFLHHTAAPQGYAGAEEVGYGYGYG